jgi:hypothetical protein
MGFTRADAAEALVVRDGHLDRIITDFTDRVVGINALLKVVGMPLAVQVRVQPGRRLAASEGPALGRLRRVPDVFEAAEAQPQPLLQRGMRIPGRQGERFGFRSWIMEKDCEGHPFSSDLR